MGLREQQNFLAKLFTDENLRISFYDNPEKIGQENKLNETEIDQLKGIIAADLNFFADSLINKRLHEAKKILPLTEKVLDSDFNDLFQDFSTQFQPTSVKKHLEDAIEFCKYLQLQPVGNVYLKDTAKFEQTKLEFFQKEKSFSFCILRHNIFTARKRPCLAIWYRSGNHSRHLIW